MERKKTFIGFTTTSEGDIPHLEHKGLRCPVMLCTKPDEQGRPVIVKHNDLPVPKRDEHGRLLFALPGGEQTTAPIKTPA